MPRPLYVGGEPRVVVVESPSGPLAGRGLEVTTTGRLDARDVVELVDELDAWLEANGYSRNR